MTLGRGERVPQHVGAEARAAHAEEDDVGNGSALPGEISELSRLLEHLLRDVEPSEAVVDLLAFRGVGGPQRRVLGPQAARSVVLLQLRDLCVDGGLEPAEAVPLAGALAGPNVLSALLECAEQALERFRE